MGRSTLCVEMHLGSALPFTAISEMGLWRCASCLRTCSYRIDELICRALDYRSRSTWAWRCRSR